MSYIVEIVWGPHIRLDDFIVYVVIIVGGVITVWGSTDGGFISHGGVHNGSHRLISEVSYCMGVSTVMKVLWRNHVDDPV